MKALRIKGSTIDPCNMRVELDGELVPGVERIEVVVDARTGAPNGVWLKFGYVELDLEVPGVGMSPLPKREPLYRRGCEFCDSVSGTHLQWCPRATRLRFNPAA